MGLGRRREGGVSIRVVRLVLLSSDTNRFHTDIIQVGLGR